MANILDIVAEARDLVDADSVSYPDAKILRRLNKSEDEVEGLILQCDGSWDFGSSAYSSLPVGTKTLTEGTALYKLFDSTSANEFAQIIELERLEIKDVNGKWRPLTPITLEEIAAMGFTEGEFMTAATGVPLYYRKVENFIKLYGPASATWVTLANGLKAFFTRSHAAYSSGNLSSTTITPGFVPLYHYILSAKIALPYANAYKKDRVPALLKEIADNEAGITKHYTKRAKDERPVVTMKRINHI